MMGCSFSGGSACEMSKCEDGDVVWTMVTQADGGPSRDHTHLPNGNGSQGMIYRIIYFKFISSPPPNT